MKILFLAEAVSLAHIGRPLILAKWAYENNAEIHFAASADGLTKINATSFGFKTYPLFTIKDSLFYDRVNQGKFFYQVNELKKYVAEEKKLILKINPDLIVSDFRLTAAISSELTSKPLLNLSNAYWSPYYACPFPAPEAGIFKLFSQGTSDFIFNFIRPLAFKIFGKELNQTRKYFGLKKKQDFRELYTDGSFTAYMDLPNFINVEKLPEKHFFIGPIIWSPETNSVRYCLKEKNNVYITMGSKGSNATLLNIIKSVLKHNLNIILSGVSALEKESLRRNYPELNGRSIMEPLIKAEEILPYCKLTICHGGSGTVYQSIASGVPVLCFPKNPDQGLVSLAVAQKNIGRFLTYKTTNTKTIDAMINECLTNEVILQNAKNMQNDLSLWDTKKHWKQFLNRFKTIRKSKKVIA
jgi:UDP:flavonoid glycosyltransferase YjiC (YdhE family)